MYISLQNCITLPAIFAELFAPLKLRNMGRWQSGDYAHLFFSSYVENSGCYGNK
jgi:hypothetical protein